MIALKMLGFQRKVLFYSYPVNVHFLTNINQTIKFVNTSHAFTRAARQPGDSQKQSRYGLCSNPPNVRSVCDIALNPSLRKSKRE